MTSLLTKCGHPYLDFDWLFGGFSAIENECLVPHGVDVVPHYPAIATTALTAHATVSG